MAKYLHQIAKTLFFFVFFQDWCYISFLLIWISKTQFDQNVSMETYISDCWVSLGFFNIMFKNRDFAIEVILQKGRLASPHHCPIVCQINQIYICMKDLIYCFYFDIYKFDIMKIVFRLNVILWNVWRH